MTRGEVWWANMPRPWGRRPFLLLSRDDAYAALTWVIGAPLTTRVRAIATSVILTPTDDGLPRYCAVTLDNMQAVRVAWLEDRIVRLRDTKMDEVDSAIHFALGLRT